MDDISSALKVLETRSKELRGEKIVEKKPSKIYYRMSTTNIWTTSASTSTSGYLPF